jgi:hypothetical protein
MNIRDDHEKTLNVKLKTCIDKLHCWFDLIGILMVFCWKFNVLFIILKKKEYFFVKFIVMYYLYKFVT